MDASHINSMVDSSFGDGPDEQEKGGEQSLQPDPDYHELGPRDFSKFHDTIKEEDWDKLEKLIKNYKAHYFKKKRVEARDLEKLEQEEEEQTREKEEEGVELTMLERTRQYIPFVGEKPSKAYRDRRKRTVAKKVLPRFVTNKIFVDPGDILSPLLMVDSDGRTPLHLALIHKAPEKMIMDILEAEKKASSMKDNESQVPLHCAIQTWQPDPLIERLVKANANALKCKDKDGRTPVGLAVELAREGRDEDTIEEDSDAPFLWITATSKREKNWQFQQEMRWPKVNCLLRQLIDRRKVVIPSEHGLILEALEGGADPNTIIRFISTSDKYLLMDDELAGAAIGLCVERHYKLDVLEYLMENCREKTTVVTDIIQKAVKTHYAKGCYPIRKGMVPFGKRVIDWSKKQKRDEKRAKKKEAKKKKKEKKKSKEDFKKVSFKIAEDKDDGDKKKKEWTGMKESSKDWWENLNHLLFYCTYGRDYKLKVKPKTFHLLHAALSAPMTPPSLVHLLLIVYPEAIYEKCPVYKVLPVHIASTRWRYDVIYNDSEASSLEQVLLHLFESDPNQLYRRHKGSLPIHMALFGGQFWAFIKSLVITDKKVLGMRDAQSRLFPFQIATLPIRFRNIQLLMRCQFNPTAWREMSFLEKKDAYEKVVEEQEMRQLSTIYEMLRAYPDAIENKLLTKDSSIASKNLSSLSALSIHYLSWVYSRTSTGGYSVRYDNLTALRNSIFEAKVLPELEQWWFELKECIWNDSHREIPRTNDYLLHSALYNCETPPLVTELLIQLFPLSTAKPIPSTLTYPLHIAAATTSYQRQQFEIPYGMNNLRLVLKAYKEATRFKSNGRLALHICLARGKSWKEIRPLIMVNPSSLKVKDGQTGMVPFELMASFKLSAKANSLWYSAFTEKQMNSFSFHELSTQDKAKALAAARKKTELSQLTCIFELIRHRPSVLTVRYSGLIVGNDDDSVTSLFSFVDDGYDVKAGGVEQWETLDDSQWETLDDSSTRQRQGSMRELLSRADSGRNSMRSLNDGYDAPALITPFDPLLDKSLSSYLLEKSSSPIILTDKKTKRKRNKRKNSYSRPKARFERRGTKMALFDYNDLDLSNFDDDDSSESSSEKNGGKTSRAKIPMKLPNLED